MWYRRVQSDLKGLSKAQVAQRLQQIGTPTVSGGNIFGRVGGVGLHNRAKVGPPFFVKRGWVGFFNMVS